MKVNLIKISEPYSPGFRNSYLSPSSCLFSQTSSLSLLSLILAPKRVTYNCSLGSSTVMRKVCSKAALVVTTGKGVMRLYSLGLVSFRLFDETDIDRFVLDFDSLPFESVVDLSKKKEDKVVRLTINSAAFQLTFVLFAQPSI